ncbi:MAG TPA: NADPH-dependent F420 reductase [Dehalococcoidia bacterium]|nr:NADPH-dependent F420 reductase [Dehalococcoidia bacterium]
MIAIIGGTGDEGLGLAMRFAAAGEAVVIGSRSHERAAAAAEKVRQAVPDARVEGAENPEAVRRAETVIIAVPYSGQRDTVTALKDLIGTKLTINIVVPMEFGQGGARAVAVEEGSAAEQTKAILGPDSRLVSAFHNLSSHELMAVGKPLDCDVLVCGGDTESRKQVLDLAARLPGCRGIDAGPLRNSRYIEDITVLLVGINRRYKTQSGVRIVGLSQD